MRYAEEELSTKGNTAFMEYGKKSTKTPVQSCANCTIRMVSA